ncbi:MAG TPA: carboxypeptidase regulatory-like domain-containing protein [Polyangia bacterium]|nr:carboxypeptidase regulatory-like domain-containing protein [Polyangia bacterium]
MKISRAWLGLVCVTLAAAACKKEEPRSEPVVVAQGAAAQKLLTPEAAGAPAGGTAAIKGTVTLTGVPPEMPLTKRDADPYCARTPMKDEEVVVGAGGALKNVIVRIVKGISGNYEPPMTNLTLDQTQCMYRPRVAVIMAGQSLLVRNSDQTLHNVHTYKGASTLFNQAEVPGLPAIAKTFKDATGEILKFKCDVHPWMTGYVAVMGHPFFAVTGGDGKYEIPKVPAGKYTVEAWHERFGTKSQEVTVEAGKPLELAFSFESK